jgi:Ca2+-dependent lipid-binding protein
MNYPDYEHHINVKSYNELSPNDDSPTNRVIISFLRCRLNSQLALPFQLVFVSAELTRSTDIISSKHPYIKVLVGGVEKWRSPLIKNGNSRPNFNRETATLSIASLEETIRIEVWKEDVFRDDFVGGFEVKAFELVGKNGQTLEETLLYIGRDKMDKAGAIKFEANAPTFS